jgi:hypothetical protein
MSYRIEKGRVEFEVLLIIVAHNLRDIDKGPVGLKGAHLYEVRR